MTATAIRQRLHEYIRFADDKKVKAFFNILKKEADESHDIWTKEFLAELSLRSIELKTGKVKGKEWSSVLKKSRAVIAAKK
jgi:hypothetical protein